MFRIFTKLIIVLIASCVLFVKPATAVKIVRLELEYGSDVVASGGFDIPKTNETLYLELYDDISPNTVANYLNYVSSGAYDLTFINRSVPGFVLQTGGVSKLPGTENDQLAPNLFIEVVSFGTVDNEASLSNVRGTIAMATVAGQPDSATNEWFINLKDNSSSLDIDNGGFTVFGSVIDNGMEVADQVSTFPLTNAGFIFGSLGSFFTELPLADTDLSSSPSLVQSNLVMILSATEISRPIMRLAPGASNFGFESIGSVAGKTIDVVVRNTGDEALDIAAIAPADISAPFSIQSENCSNATLDVLSDPFSAAPVSSCTISLLFLPAEAGVFSDNLTINYTSGAIAGGSFSVKYPVLGEGAIGVPEIAVANTFDVGASQVDGYASTKELIVNNTGQASLQIAEITGLSATDFSQTNDCIGGAVLIAPGESCTITVKFTTADFGAKTAALSIESNDPVNSIVDIELTAHGDNDADGVASAIEDAAPNAGDNNFDGIIDSLQNIVASFATNTGEYISLWVNANDSNNVVSNISTTSREQLNGLPTDVEFKYGVVEFDVVIDSPGAIIQVALVLPVATGLEAYYLFGETTDNTTPHWYRYVPVQVLADSSLVTNSNSSSDNRDRIILTVQDGGSGDADQIVNGRIRIGPGAPAYSTKTSSGSGSSAMNILFLGIFAVVLITLKRRYR